MLELRAASLWTDALLQHAPLAPPADWPLLAPDADAGVARAMWAWCVARQMLLVDEFGAACARRALGARDDAALAARLLAFARETLARDYSRGSLRGRAPRGRRTPRRARRRAARARRASPRT